MAVIPSIDRCSWTEQLTAPLAYVSTRRSLLAWQNSCRGSHRRYWRDRFGKARGVDIRSGTARWSEECAVEHHITFRNPGPGTPLTLRCSIALRHLKKFYSSKFVILLKNGYRSISQVTAALQKIEIKELLRKMIKKTLFVLVSEESIAVAQNCWRSAATNGIYLPVYVVIVDDMKEPEPTPIEQRWRDHQFIQLDIKYHHINNQMLAIPRNFFKKI